MKTKSLKDKIIFKKYKIMKFISSSTFSDVYEGINIINRTPVALKIEKINNLKLLESEAYFLMQLKGFGIPEIKSFGKSGGFHILIEELLGPNLDDLFIKYKYNVNPNVKKIKSLKDICMFALQSLDRIKYVHDKNVLHRDIKPKNFIIGKKDPHNIYLIDFGFSRKYRSSRTGRHIIFIKHYNLVGSLCYSSCNGIQGYEISRRDDLESLGYVIIYFAKGCWLPWLKYDNYINLDTKELIEKIRKMKMEISEEKLCNGLPEEFISYMKYVKHLEFEEEPNYQYLYNLFLSVLTKNELINDLNFFWMIKPKLTLFFRKINQDNQNITLKNDTTVKRKKSRIRLYNQIKKSLEKKRNQNDKYLEENTFICENRIITTINDSDKNILLNNTARPLNNILSLKDNKGQKNITTINNSDKNILLYDNGSHKNVKEKKLYFRNVNNNVNKLVDKRDKLKNNSQNNNFQIIFKNRCEKIKKKPIIFKINQIYKSPFINISDYSKPNINLYKYINYNQLYFINNSRLKVYNSKLKNTKNNSSQNNINNSTSLDKRKIYKSVLPK